MIVINSYFKSYQHVYEDNQKNFDKEGTVLNTCNQFNPAQYNPEIFQPVELADEEVSELL